MKIFTVVLLSFSLAACQGTDWGKVAIGVGAITSAIPAAKRLDARVASASEQIATYCPALQVIAAVAGTTLEKQRAAILQASAALNEVCFAPPKDVEAAAIVAARAFRAAEDAKVVPASN